MPLDGGLFFSWQRNLERPLDFGRTEDNRLNNSEAVDSRSCQRRRRPSLCEIYIYARRKGRYATVVVSRKEKMNLLDSFERKQKHGPKEGHKGGSK